MRTTIWTFLLAALLTLGASGSARAQYAEPEQVDDVNVFYDSLSPYGDWVQTEEYGLVWKPVGVAADWRPYTYGRWVWTDDHGWYWASYYEWGWAPFHYGRWAMYPAYGWVWIPGTVWAPAWVSWRYSDAYIGWYPLWPEFVVVSGVWYPYPAHVHHHEHWVFVETQQFTSGDQRHHYVPAGRASHVYAATKESHEYRGKGAETHLSGPPREQVEKSGGMKIPSASLSESPRPASVVQLKKGGGTIGVYRPQFAQKAQVYLPKATAAKLPEAARPSVGTAATFAPRGAPGKGGAAAPASLGQQGRPRYNAPLGAPGQDGAQGYRKKPYGGAPAYNKGNAPQQRPRGDDRQRPAAVPGGVHRPAVPDGDGEGYTPPPAVKSKPRVKEKKPQ